MQHSIELLNGDCLEEMKHLGDQSVNLVLTSPPYNMQTRVRNGEYTSREKADSSFSKKYINFGDDLSLEEYFQFHKAALYEMLRVSKCILYNIQILTGNKEAVFKLIGEFSDNIKDIIIWDKGHGQPSMAERVINKGSEFIIILESNATKGRALTHSNFERGTMPDMWRIGSYTKPNGVDHGATFPIPLAEKAILNFSKRGDVVLDPFMGTGTTGVVCQKHDRKFIGIELMSEYFYYAKQRIIDDAYDIELLGW